MEHTRKMVLVSEESVGKLQLNTGHTSEVIQKYNEPMTTVQTPGTYLSRLDNEMGEILRSTQMNDREKWTSYQQTLQRYLNFQNNTRSTASPKTDETNNESIRGISSESIVSSVPTSFRRKAELLVQFLNNPYVKERITWDNRGTVTIDGTNIDHSNIIDLVNDLARSRKGIKAVGREHFSWFLRNTGIPQEFVGNQDLYNLGNKFKPNSIINEQQTPTRTSFNKSVEQRSDIRISTPIPKKKLKNFSSSLEESETSDSTIIENFHNSSKVSPRITRQKAKYNSQKGHGWLTLSW